VLFEIPSCFLIGWVSQLSDIASQVFFELRDKQVRVDKHSTCWGMSDRGGIPSADDYPLLCHTAVVEPAAARSVEYGDHLFWDSDYLLKVLATLFQ
jgi:hypothetical protein